MRLLQSAPLLTETFGDRLARLRTPSGPPLGDPGAAGGQRAHEEVVGDREVALGSDAVK
jgi:hypothetical protein